jgi:hypothetical protein
LLEKIKLHHEELDAGLPEDKPPCPDWSDEENCHGLVIFKGQVVRRGLKTGTEDHLPHVRLRQCLCRLHGAFRVYTGLVLPHKHYVACTVEAALQGVAEGMTRSSFCSEHRVHDPRTPGRWIAQWVERLQATGQIVERFLNRWRHHWSAMDRPPDPPEWTCHSAWKYLSAVLAEWPTVLPEPPRSYLALKA